MGQIANTNAQYISAELPKVGIGVYYHDVVGDNQERLKACLSLALSRSDVIILTGGLGPTRDDLTKETVASVLNRKLILDQQCLDVMTEFFAKRNRVMSKNNIKQAFLPEGCIIVRNKNGTAPGCIIEEGDKTIVMLPGPPSEMRPMFDKSVLPYFASKSDVKLVSRFLRIFGIGESAMEDKIIDLVDSQLNPTIAPYAKDGEVMLRITASYPIDGPHEDIITPVLEEIRRRFGDAVYSDDNSSLQQVVARLLIEKKMTISIAESCTGGMLSAKLTDIPGISDVFDRCIVTYSDRSKVEELGVRQETLDKHGAVSEETAKEMAECIRSISSTDIGVSITGIAGPDGGSNEKPVGTVYIALADKKGVKAQKLSLWGGRERIRNVACLHSFDMIRRYLSSAAEDEDC